MSIRPPRNGNFYGNNDGANVARQVAIEKLLVSPIIWIARQLRRLAPAEQPPPGTSDGWLRSQGFTVKVEQGDGKFVASLVRLDGQIVARDYGRGDSESSAVAAAEDRFRDAL